MDDGALERLSYADRIAVEAAIAQCRASGNTIRLPHDGQGVIDVYRAQGGVLKWRLVARYCLACGEAPEVMASPPEELEDIQPRARLALGLGSEY
jgi:hypothetical protein